MSLGAQIPRSRTPAARHTVVSQCTMRHQETQKYRIDTGFCHCATVDENFPDISYNFATDIWTCCASGPFAGAANCSNLSEETWQSPPPSQLQILASIPSSATSSGWQPTATLAATASSTNRPSSLTVSPSTASATESGTPAALNTNNGLNGGAKAGIAIGVIAVVALVAAAFAAWYMRRRRKQAQLQTDTQVRNISQWPGDKPDVKTDGGEQYDPRPREMSHDSAVFNTSPAEVPGSHAGTRRSKGELHEMPSGQKDSGYAAPQQLHEQSLAELPSG